MSTSVSHNNIANTNAVTSVADLDSDNQQAVNNGKPTAMSTEDHNITTAYASVDEHNSTGD